MSPVSAGLWMNGKAPAPAHPWHPHQLFQQNHLLCTAGEELGGQPARAQHKAGNLCFIKNTPFFPLFLRNLGIGSMVSMTLAVVFG